MESVDNPAPLTRAIETIYSYFKGDQEFTEFMKDLEDFLAVGETGHPVFSGEIGKHFNIAAELAQVMSPAPEAKYRSLVEGPALKIVFDRALRIVAQSSQARNLFGYIDGFVITHDKNNKAVISTEAAAYSADQVEQLQMSLSGPVLETVAALFGHNTQQPGGNRSFVRREGESGFVSLNHNLELDVVVVTLPGASWSASIPVVLSGSFGLSPSENEVLELMANGKSNVEISRDRFRSVDTVKSQTQAIFRKLGVASRLEAVQVVNDLVSLAALSGGVPDPGVTIASPTNSFPFAHDISSWRTADSGGRQISYVHYPAPPGTAGETCPVLMFHGLLQGPELTMAARHGLSCAGFEYLGISKPGYGATRPPFRNRPMIQSCIEDAVYVCDQHGVGRSLVLGHLFGAHAAIEYCLTHPERVSGLVLCSAYYPLQMAEHLVPVGVLQKLAMSSGIASAAAHRFIALTAVAYLRYGGSNRYLSALAENCPGDRKAIQDQEIYGLLRAGIHHVTVGGASAFLADTSASDSDWSERLALLNLPVIVLHGESDPAVNSKIARLAAGRIANCRYEEIPEIGQHILHAIPEKVIAALKEIHAAAAEN
ncbi:putative hydrolase or acyltransferase of alpha/beta superfamily [Hoeflea sp. IMCC20628]|uniref:alpha/beta fold hydrolase n=1 Tax=Hoeflea sp. IMCC20628 TaxID=1620421 RepID=UPI00063AD914|nr:alpha/beta fold hydrolase [Hoeflea sp. IMCC20628]AKH99147.1 putative hydrolase or acyltransferase of alpha/beta superfamily [Hoeflea sp. IMCC20628]